MEPSQADIDLLLALFNRQRYAEAQACADKLTQRFPQHGFTWKALGAIHKKSGNPEAAIAALTKAALLLPADADVRYNLGNSYLEQNKLSLAESCYQQALAIQPGYMAAHYNLGKAYQELGNFDAAVASYKIALSLQPDFVEALSSLGVALHSLGKNDEAESSYRQALKINPYSWQPVHNLANLLHNQKRFAEAETMYVQVVQLRPEFDRAWFDLGNCLFAQSRYPEAEIGYREALRLNPDYAEAYNHLGIAQKEQERLSEAEQSYRNALQLKPDYVEVHNNLGNVLRELDRIAEAEVCYHRALELNPDYAEAHNNLGIALKAAGRLGEARMSLEKAIAINPEFLEPHFGIATLKTYRDDDPQIAQLEKQLATVHELKPEAQIRCWFAIGKMYEDLGRFDASFSAYENGNRLKFSSLSWDEEKETALVSRIKKLFGKDFFERAKALQNAENRQPVPELTAIFILGMPRSGTSLLEQILSTHPGVFGAGELMAMNEVIVKAMPGSDYQHYPDAVANFSAAQWQQLGENYLNKLSELAPDASHITDKMPANFLHIGMIHLMFPTAKIIHAMRDPMDSCFSNYSRLFNKNNIAFSYDLKALGHYYNRYIDLMEHWHAVLPAGTILDCRYEDMVENTEAQARRLLDYIGLPWDERCLDFHKNKRRVKTASQAQVQKPIYKSSVARWKPFEKYLGPLAELINSRLL